MEEKWGPFLQDVRGNYNATSMYGDASVHIHPQTPISSVLPERVWMVPYRQNAFFTGREQLLNDLHTRFMKDRSTVLTRGQAITGLGGIGKTQIAMEYAYRYREEYRFVLWVSAATRETLVANVTRIADRLQLPERTLQEQEKIVAAVLHWLATREGWLLIVDNADDLDSIVDLLPTGDSGHLLLTTRQQTTGNFEPFPIQQMDQQEGTLFLLRRAGFLKLGNELPPILTNDQQIVEQIVREMAGLPLALDQAGAYIQETGCSLSDYLTHFRNQRSYLLKRRGRNSSQYPASVATTWSISFERVEQHLPVAADILRLCAFLAPDAIPEEIIAAEEENSPLLELVTNAVLLDEAISVLSSYSLVLRNRQEKTLSIHRLVQAVLQDAMTKEKAQEWAKRAIFMTNTAFPEIVNFAQSSRGERFIATALVCWNWIREMSMVFPEAMQLLDSTGHYLRIRARYNEAEPLLTYTLSIREKQFSEMDSDTVHSLNHLAQLYKELGRYGEAELLWKRILEIEKRPGGPQQTLRSLLGCLDSLGDLYVDQGRYKEAEPLLKRSLKVREDVFKKKPLDISNSLNLLAKLYLSQKNYEEAEPLLIRALALREQYLGDTDPRTAISLGSLAVFYLSQERYEKAEALLARSLEIEEQLLGSEHPGIATTLHNLAACYEELEKYEKAELLYQRALAITEQQLGSGHPLVAYNLSSLARIYRKQEKYREAKPLYQRALAIQEQQLGESHPNIAESLQGLAVLYVIEEKYREAETLLVRALAIREQLLGSENSDIANVLEMLAVVYYAQKKYREAEPLFVRYLAIQEQQSKKSDPEIVSDLNMLANIYIYQGRYTEAESLYLQALAIDTKTYGTDSPNTATSLKSLAFLYKEQGKYVEAEPLYQRMISIKEQQLGERHLDTVECLNNLAELNWVQGKYATAQLFYMRALAIREQQLGSEHLNTAESLNNLAELYREQGKYTRAEPLAVRALAIREQQLGSESPDTAESLNNLGLLYYQQEKYKEAELLLKRAMVICEHVLGQGHPLTETVRENYFSLFPDN